MPNTDLNPILTLTLKSSLRPQTAIWKSEDITFPVSSLRKVCAQNGPQKRFKYKHTLNPHAHTSGRTHTQNASFRSVNLNRVALYWAFSFLLIWPNALWMIAREMCDRCGLLYGEREDFHKNPLRTLFQRVIYNLVGLWQKRRIMLEIGIFNQTLLVLLDQELIYIYNVKVIYI